MPGSGYRCQAFQGCPPTLLVILPTDHHATVFNDQCPPMPCQSWQCWQVGRQHLLHHQRASVAISQRFLSLARFRCHLIFTLTASIFSFNFLKLLHTSPCPEMPPIQLLENPIPPLLHSTLPPSQKPPMRYLGNKEWYHICFLEKTLFKLHIYVFFWITNFVAFSYQLSKTQV